MHMADALLSPAVGGAMCAVSAAMMAYSVVKVKKDDLDEKKIPMMGVMGAFVFAAQMINFTIPATGSSGHIGGGILLAAMLGEFPAFLTISAVLIIQSLFFADGGLLALGCNIFNMGVTTCFLAYPLIFKPLVRRGMNAKNITIASILSVVIGLLAGAFSVVLETLLSGITELPFGTFVGLMLPIHLAIGAVEGIVTAAVLVFVYRMRPEAMHLSEPETSAEKTPTLRRVIVPLAVMAVLLGGVLSNFASANPDGLEWAMEGTAGTAELTANDGVHAAAASVQDQTAFMPDYDYKSGGENAISGTSVAGLVGAGLTFALAGLAGVAIHFVKKRKGASAES